LFLAKERVLVFGFRLKNDKGEGLFIEEEEIDKSSFGLLEVLTKRFYVLGLEPDAGFELDVGRYNTPENLDQGLRWIRCLNGKSIQETNDGEQA